ncbi:MAG: hypothetical protein ACYC3Q_01175 [Gemmatimonadaceae bacterium]
MARERLDARIGEIAFTVPAYGDLLVLGNNALSYRKRLAPVATVCAFDGMTLTIRLQRTELNLLRVGDSVAVLRTSSTPANPRFATAALTTVTPGASCQPLTPGAVTLAAPLAAPLPASEVARGATTRVWSVRSYAVEADPAAPGRYQLIERVNGADPAKLFGPFANPSVFTYWQDEAGTIPATDALNTTLLRASFTPIVALASRARAAAGAEVMEFPVGEPPRNEVRGEVPPPTGPVTPLPSCHTPGATNYGDPIHECTFAPGTAVVTATPNPATDADVVLVSGASSFASGSATITAYEWTVNGAAFGGGQASFSVKFSQGANTIALRVQDSRGAWSPVTTVVLAVSASCTPPPSQTRTVACNAGEIGTGYTEQQDYSTATCSWGGWYRTGGDCTAGCPAGTVLSGGSCVAACPFAGLGTLQATDIACFERKCEARIYQLQPQGGDPKWVSDEEYEVWVTYYGDGRVAQGSELLTFQCTTYFDGTYNCVGTRACTGG